MTANQPARRPGITRTLMLFAPVEGTLWQPVPEK